MTKGRYNLRVSVDFSAAHTLDGYPGPCHRLHGHNWKVEVEVEATRLDEIGMGLDFKVIRESAQTLIGELDHRYLNEVPPFDTTNPTAENIAAYIYHGLTHQLNNEHAHVSAVTLWETERACVRYTEDSTT